jgi:hypothetical protein
MENDLIKYFLPPQLVEHFEVEKLVEYPIPGSKLQELHIHLAEKNILPDGNNPEDWESKGFTEPKKIQDFPLRGKMVFLILKCRRWRSKIDPATTIRNDFSFLADGAKMTADLAAFLKGTGRRA